MRDVQAVKVPAEKLLSRREMYLLKKFRIGYVAWCGSHNLVANLVPGKGVVCGKSERVRCDTLTHMTALGYLREWQERSSIYNIHGDIHWVIASSADSMSDDQ